MLDDRTAIARYLIERGTDLVDLELEPDLTILPPGAGLTADLAIPFPAGLAPIPRPLAPAPTPEAALPRADVVAITWTVAEQDALADVLTPGFGRKAWYRYNRRFAEDYAPQIRAGAPAATARRLGSYFLTTIGPHSVLCFKSELHLNQDGVRTGDGTATLPVRQLFHQIIAEAQPKVVLTVGTAGGVAPDHDLGDVVVTRGAKFRLSQEFKNEAFRSQHYQSDWPIPTQHFATAEQLMARFANNLVEPAFGPPTKKYPVRGPLLTPQPNLPDIKLDGRDMPAFHPILTTDFFEFGTSGNNLDQEGCGVEMGDAVLGMVADELPTPPRWAVVRNMSDPPINADLPLGRGALNMQTHWAVWYYEAYGYWTSVMSALATWAIVAGLEAN